MRCSSRAQDLGGGGSGDTVRPLIRWAIGARNRKASEMPIALASGATMAPCTEAHVAAHALPIEQVPRQEPQLQPMQPSPQADPQPSLSADLDPTTCRFLTGKPAEAREAREPELARTRAGVDAIWPSACAPRVAAAPATAVETTRCA